MRLVSVLTIAGLAGMMLSGCASTKPQQRGWVGGAFTEANTCVFVRDYRNDPNGVVRALPREVSGKQKGGLVVSSLEDESSLFRAGVRTGDLIVSMNGAPVASAKDWYGIVDRLQPGSTATAGVWRDGARIDVPVTVGSETYWRRGYISLGFGLGTTLKLLPDPDFNIFNLVRVSPSQRRGGLYQPERRYIASVEPRAEELQNRLWDVWFLIAGTGRYDIIQSQTAGPVQK